MHRNGTLHLQHTRWTFTLLTLLLLLLNLLGLLGLPASSSTHFDLLGRPLNFPQTPQGFLRMMLGVALGHLLFAHLHPVARKQPLLHGVYRTLVLMLFSVQVLQMQLHGAGSSLSVMWVACPLWLAFPLASHWAKHLQRC